MDGVIERLAGFDWVVFTSSNGVAALLGRIWALGLDSRAFGAAWRRLAREPRWRWPKRGCGPIWFPRRFVRKRWRPRLAPHVSGKRVLWARASRGRDVLPTELTKAGATLEEVVVYRNLDVAELDGETRRLLNGGRVDWICLSSPSIARGVARLLPGTAHGRLGKELRIASISPVTDRRGGNRRWLASRGRSRCAYLGGTAARARSLCRQIVIVPPAAIASASH